MAIIVARNTGLSETRYMLLQQGANSDSRDSTPAYTHRVGLREVLQGAFAAFWKKHMAIERPNLVVSVPTDGDDIEDAPIPEERSASRFNRTQPVVLIVEVGFPILRMDPNALGSALAQAAQEFFSATLKEQRPVEIHVHDGEGQATSLLPMPTQSDC